MSALDGLLYGCLILNISLHNLGSLAFELFHSWFGRVSRDAADLELLR
jgi:hypothetical protein